MKPKGVKASVWLAMRTNLLNALAEIDSEIDKALRNRTSKRAAVRAKQLFDERERVVVELERFGLDPGPHRAVLDA